MVLCLWAPSLSICGCPAKQRALWNALSGFHDQLRGEPARWLQGASAKCSVLILWHNPLSKARLFQEALAAAPGYGENTSRKSRSSPKDKRGVLSLLEFFMCSRASSARPARAIECPSAAFPTSTASVVWAADCVVFVSSSIADINKTVPVKVAFWYRH